MKQSTHSIDLENFGNQVLSWDEAMEKIPV